VHAWSLCRSSGSGEAPAVTVLSEGFARQPQLPAGHLLAALPMSWPRSPLTSR